MSQYNFYQRKKDNTPNLNQQIKPPKYTNPDEICQKILEHYDKYYHLINNDPEAKILEQLKKETSDKILKTYGLLQRKDAHWTDEEITVLNQTLNELDQEHQTISKQHENYISEHMKWLIDNFPDIYDRIANGTSKLERATLEHVLKAFADSEKGTISKKDAVCRGLDYMTEKNNLPSDFFDRSKVNMFIN